MPRRRGSCALPVVSAESSVPFADSSRPVQAVVLSRRHERLKARPVSLHYVRTEKLPIYTFIHEDTTSGYERTQSHTGRAWKSILQGSRL